SVALARLIDGALDIVLGHGLGLGCVHGQTQARVHVRIGHAHLGGHGDFAAELGEHGGALLVLRPLAMHDILEFAMACHSDFLRLNDGKIERASYRAGRGEATGPIRGRAAAWPGAPDRYPAARGAAAPAQRCLAPAHGPRWTASRP